jgi:hypothetical protein
VEAGLLVFRALATVQLRQLLSELIQAWSQSGFERL